MVTCEKRKTKLQMVPPDKALALVKRAKFLDVYWVRRPHALARDENGVYYYVDRLGGADSITGAYRGFRIYVGERGKMKRLRMRNVVSDEKGEIFITEDGNLKLVLDVTPSKKTLSAAAWIAKKKRADLVPLRVGFFRTRTMIYRELGVYAGLRLHRPCDDF
jgi:hypothetical protein